MQTPLRITFRHMDPSNSVEARIRDHMDRLERFHDRITGCHVIVEAPAGHRRHGAPYEITIDLTVPGREIAVRTGHADHGTHSDIYVAIRDAFDDAKRQLHSEDLLPHDARREHAKHADDPSDSART